MPELESVMLEQLTDWENEPTIRVLKKDLDNAKVPHDYQVSKINRWTDLLKVEGSQKPKSIKGRSSVQPKLVRRQAEWRYSALTEPFLSSYRLFSINPRTFEDGPAARQNQILLNYQFDQKINKQKFIDDFVRTTVDEGTCIVQVGWTRVTKPVVRMEQIYDYYPVTDQNQAEQISQLSELKTQNRKQYDEQVDDATKASVDFSTQSGSPAIAQPIGMQPVETEDVIKNEPTLKIHDPANVYIDPSCEGDIEKAKFVIVSFETCKADLLAEGRYHNLDAIDWKVLGVGDQEYYKTKTPDEFNFEDTARRKTIAFEYWGYFDIHGNDTLVPIVATWVDNTIIRMEENPFPDEKLPFVVTTYLPVKRELYGEPDAELLEDNQKILGAITRGLIDSLGRSANGQQGYAKGFLDPINKRRFMNGEDYEFNPAMPPQQAYVEHQFPELPQSAMLMLELQNQEAESLTGVKAFSGGIAGDAYSQQSAYTSSAAVRGVLDAASKREMGILRRLAKGMTQIGEKIIAMNSVFLEEKEVVRITNTEFINIYREDLKGNFDLVVDIATAEVDNAKAQDLGFMLQTMGPNMDQQLSMKILAEIADLKRMPELAEDLRQWKPDEEKMQLEKELARMQVELVKAQVQLTMAQAQREAAEAQAAGANAQVNAMKAQNEQAKTQIAMVDAQAKQQKVNSEIQEINANVNLKTAQSYKESAEAERLKLETFEESSGLNHQRNLELQRAQARGNQNLEILKGIMHPLKEGEKEANVDAGIGFNALMDEEDALKKQGYL